MVTTRADRLRRYGLTIAEYEEMAAVWDGLCWICEQPEPNNRRLAVDHDHTTGLVRGLLCTNCNRAIGLMRDDPARLEQAARYLQGATTHRWWGET